MAEESTAGDGDSQFKDIVKDLFNIEVNTILRDKISAQKMPAVRNALLDIGGEYFEVLDQVEKVYRRAKKLDIEFKMNDKRQSLGFYTKEEYEKAQQGTSGIKGEFMIVGPPVCDQLGGFQAFALMRRWADELLRDPKCADYLEEKKHLLSVLPRIRENADMLKGMFSAICRRDEELRGKGLMVRLDELKEAGKLTPESVVQEGQKIDEDRTQNLTNQYTRSDILSRDDIGALPISHSELVLIRKIWEVGTEVIAMQTTIQVDGDVITRLNPNYLDRKNYEKLSEYHKDGVKMALAYWGNLVGIARALLDRLTGK
jgi:hypothetical protein